MNILNRKSKKFNQSKRKQLAVTTYLALNREVMFIISSYAASSVELVLTQALSASFETGNEHLK